MLFINIVLWSIALFSFAIFLRFFIDYVHRQYILWKSERVIRKLSKNIKHEETKEKLSEIADDLKVIRKSDEIIGFDED